MDGAGENLLASSNSTASEFVVTLPLHKQSISIIMTSALTPTSECNIITAERGKVNQLWHLFMPPPNFSVRSSILITEIQRCYAVQADKILITPTIKDHLMG